MSFKPLPALADGRKHLLLHQEPPRAQPTTSTDLGCCGNPFSFRFLLKLPCQHLLFIFRLLWVTSEWRAEGNKDRTQGGAQVIPFCLVAQSTWLGRALPCAAALTWTSSSSCVPQLWPSELRSGSQPQPDYQLQWPGRH